MSQNDLIIIEPGSRELDASQVKQQMTMIGQLMKDVLKQDVHYGTIPGCGDKPALLQPGAQKLGAMFNLGAKYHITATDMPHGHREYQVICELSHRASGRFIGEGVGACSTMESKYRYRWDDTGQAVPQEYWNSRDKDLLGGPSFVPRKTQGKWKIYQRVEHDNPGDYYNTALKIAKKRAYNDAILTSTAASDIFVPDDDVPPEYITPDDPENETQETVQKPARKSNGNGGGQISTEKQQKMIYARMQSNGISREQFEEAFGPLDSLPFDKVNEALEWISNFEPADGTPY